jgi:invasion protein IalB
VRALSFRLIGLAAAFAALAGPAASQGAIRSMHGEWKVRCDTPPGARREQCMLTQSATTEDHPRAQLRVLVLKTADFKSRLMQIVVPLGVQIGAGLLVKIDDTEIGRAGFVRCLPIGCIAEVVLDDAMLQKWRSGQRASFTLATGEQTIGFAIPLTGFGEGYDKLP